MDQRRFAEKLEDRNGNTITIERGVNEQITRIVDASGLRALTLQYDAGGRVQEISDPINRTVRYTYNPAGYLETFMNSAGGLTTYTYDTTGNLLTIVDPRGINYLTNEYDSQSRITRQTLADGATFTATYGSFGTTITDISTTDTRGNTTRTRFNAQRYAAQRTDSLGQQYRKTLDQLNQATEIRDSLNRLTKYTYDQQGNITSILDPQGNLNSFEYDPIFSRPTRITDALNQITAMTYDSQGNLLSKADPLNHSTVFTYNQFGQVLSTTDSLSQTTSFEYDAFGNLIKVIDPLGNQTTRAYDLASRPISISDSRGKTTQFTYDALNRIIQIADSIGNATQLTYDPNDNLLGVIDAKGQTHTYTYDNRDRLSTHVDHLNRIERYEYDFAANLVRYTDRKNQVTTYSYDVFNRRTGVQYSDGSTVDFAYDAVGRLIHVADSTSGNIDLTYDALDRLIQEITQQGIVNYQYDVLGRRTQMTVNGQPPVIYQQDAASRLVRVEQGAVFAALGYDNGNRRTLLSYSNGASTNYQYDLSSRLLNIAHNGSSGPIESLSYVYDAVGNRTGLTRAGAAATRLPQSVQASYNSVNEQVQFAGVTENYDPNGNLISDGTNAYQWDARNRLIGITGSVTASFVYDALGRRISKTFNGVTTQFIYDDKDIVAELGNGGVKATYLRPLTIDEPFVRQENAAEYYHRDALGSTVALSNASGGLSTTYTYEAFGKTTVTGVSSNPFQFTGRENDGGDYYYYRAREYSAKLHRFLSRDPILSPFSPLDVGLCRAQNLTTWTLPRAISRATTGTSQYLNGFSYASGNPILFGDPSGLCSYLKQIEDCSSAGRGIQDPVPGEPGLKVGECIGTEVESIGGNPAAGKGGTIKYGHCKRGYGATEECINKDFDDFYGLCSGKGRVSLPLPCSPNGPGSFKDCTKNDPSLKPRKSPGPS
jgi:RHS repeat-associated protein